MHIAIDDTYGPELPSDSKFVTGARRTHVAVVFSDEETPHVRGELNSCLKDIGTFIGTPLQEFHFVDIYNRNSPWDLVKEEINLRVFEFFVWIYKQYRWPVLIQTIDTRTLLDHKVKEFRGRIEDLDLSNTADLSLLFLLFKIKFKYKESMEPLSLFLDEGRGKPGKAFGTQIFHDWSSYRGIYASSATEPLLQIADFIAFAINRSTHLALKKKRTSIDNWFLELVGQMAIDCEDLVPIAVPASFSVTEFDDFHRLDRDKKGL